MSTCLSYLCPEHYATHLASGYLIVCSTPNACADRLATQLLKIEKMPSFIRAL